MDSSIMSLFEDDEDEHIHSGADVEAFTAALNRDIGGAPPISQPSEQTDTGPSSSHGDNPTSNQLFGQWQTTTQEENTTHQQQEQQQLSPQLTPEQTPSDMGQLQHGTGTENQNQQGGSLGEHDMLALQQNQQKSLQFAEKSQVLLPEQDPLPYPEQDRFQQSETQNQYPQMQKLTNQQGPGAVQLNNQMKQHKPAATIPFAMLIPVLRPHLDKDRNMQLQTIFARLRRNEVNKVEFLRLIKNIVGDQMLKQAAHQLQQMRQNQAQSARNSQAAQHQQYQLQPQASLQHANLSSHNAQQFSESQKISQMHSITSAQHQKGHRSPDQQARIPPSTVQMQTGTSENSAQRARQAEGQQDGQVNIIRVKQEGDLPIIPPQSVNQQQQHLQLSQSSHPVFGRPVSNYQSRSFPMPAVSSSQIQDLRQVSLSQGIVPSQLGSNQSMNLKGMPKYVQNARNESKRMMHVGSLPHITGHSAWQSPLDKDQNPGGLSSMGYVKQELIDQTVDPLHKIQLSAQSLSSFSVSQFDQGKTATHGPSKDDIAEKQSARVNFATSSTMLAASQLTGSEPTNPGHAIQMNPQTASVSTPVGANNSNVRTPPKKPSVGQKKPLEALGAPSQLPSKKQKTSGTFLDQSIEQLNDVTAVSGVNLREEEEQLLSGLKEESRASEATRRVVQEEEEKLILQKGPLQKKIAEIMAKCGIKGKSSDVDRCLSLCVEERMRGLITNLIRLSKQRVDIEKQRHRIVFTSDVRRHILSMNRKAKEDWDKKQAEEAEKLRKLNDTEGNTGAEADKEESRVKTLKANKEEDDKMRTTAANVAARAAVGGDDVLSKWQLMAEQARQKREGGFDGASGLASKDTSRKHSTNSGKGGSDSLEQENKNPSAAAASGAMRNFARNQNFMSQTKIARSISIKDVIASLEREPQMSKSNLIYRLYEDTAAEKPD